MSKYCVWNRILNYKTVSNIMFITENVDVNVVWKSCQTRNTVNTSTLGKLWKEFKVSVTTKPLYYIYIIIMKEYVYLIRAPTWEYNVLKQTTPLPTTMKFEAVIFWRSSKAYALRRRAETLVILFAYSAHC